MPTSVERIIHTAGRSGSSTLQCIEQGPYSWSEFAIKFVRLKIRAWHFDNIFLKTPTEAACACVLFCEVKIFEEEM